MADTDGVGRGCTRRRRSFAAIGMVALVAALATACAETGPPVAAPPFPGLAGVIEPSASTECKRVLVAGDSMAKAMAPYLDAALEAGGRCATVLNRAFEGASSGDWVLAIDDALDEDTPDILVIHLVGNEGYSGPSWSDPSWLSKTTANAQTITNAAVARGIEIYWVVPPISGWRCNWALPEQPLWKAWKSWLVGTLPGLAPATVGLVDWRTPFGGEQYTQAFTFADGPHDVRSPDCVHLTPYGNRLAAYMVVFGVQDEWGEPPPITTMTEPPITTTTEPPTTTTTTELTTTTSEA